MAEIPNDDPQPSLLPPATTAELTSNASLIHSAAKVLLRSDCHLGTQASPLAESADGNQVERKDFNPWGLHCHQAHLTRLCSQYPEDKRHRILTALEPAHNP